MSEQTAIAKAIISLTDVHDKFHLSRSADPQFFTEWFEELPEITDPDRELLNRLKNRYFYYADDGTISEGTVNIIMVHPLLNMMGLCDPPFKIRGEKYVKVEIEDGNDEDEEIDLEGRIDALVVQNQFWLVVIEAKRYGFTVSLAIPQTLAYMMGNPYPERTVFGMVTNGEDYVFIKLNQQMRQYDISRKFTLSDPRNNQLYDVMRVIKRITGLVLRA